MSLADRLLKKSKIEGASVLSGSDFLSSEKDMISTPVYSLNLAMSGNLMGGFTSGMTMLAGKSKSFKSLLGLMMCAAYQRKYEDGLVIFYDSEFGITDDYLKSMGIDTDRVIHLPVKNIEELKFDIIQQLEEIGRADHAMVFIDSVGNLASKKEIDDAKDEKSVADMSRAKQLKSLWRMVTPYLATKYIPLVAINHVYQTMDMYGGDVVGGGTGGIYSADNIFIIGKRKIKGKDAKDLAGHTFIMNTEKSRFIKEKSAIPFEVRFDEGIDKYSGLLDIALITGHVEKPKQGWFTRPSVEDDKSWRRAESSCGAFWEPLLKDESFLKAVTNLYSLNSGGLFDDNLSEMLNEGEELDAETGEVKPS
jgi:RecA/RadA recombinase